MRDAVKMVKDMNTKRSKGIAFIQYTCQDDAMLALETMDQKVQISMISLILLLSTMTLTTECSLLIFFLSVLYRIFMVEQSAWKLQDWVGMILVHPQGPQDPQRSGICLSKGKW